MPQAKPSQVVVHRIELQTSERRMLEEYLEARASTSYINSAIKATGPIAVGAGVIGGAWIASKTWAGITAALAGPIEDAQNALGELFSPISEEEQAARSTPNKVRDWSFIDLTDILQLAPKGSAARRAGDAGERVSDDVIDAVFGFFGL